MVTEEKVTPQQKLYEPGDLLKSDLVTILPQSLEPSLREIIAATENTGFKKLEKLLKKQTEQVPDSEQACLKALLLDLINAEIWSYYRELSAGHRAMRDTELRLEGKELPPRELLDSAREEDDEYRSELLRRAYRRHVRVLRATGRMAPQELSEMAMVEIGVINILGGCFDEEGAA